MKVWIVGTTAIAGLAGAPLGAHAGEPCDAVSTAPKVSLETQVRTQQARIEAQDAKIDDLEQQLREVTAVLSNRMDRAEAATDSGKAIATGPGAKIEGPDRRNSMSFIGAVQATFGAVDQTRTGPASSAHLRGGSEFAARASALQGVAFSNFAYQAEIDLAATGGVASAARDLYVQYNGLRPFSFTVGNIKPLTGLEASFSDRSNAGTFVEGAMLSSMYTATGARGIGLRAQTGGAHWGASLGVFGDDVNNNGIASPGAEGHGVHGRFTFAPIATRTNVLHFGVSGFDRMVATDSAGVPQLRVRAQPESTINSTRLIDTGNIATAGKVRLLGLEIAAMHGPFGVQSEWGKMYIDRIGQSDADFSGAYVAENWFMTGES